MNHSLNAQLRALLFSDFKQTVSPVSHKLNSIAHIMHRLPVLPPPPPNPCLFSTVWRQDGVRGLYRGCAVNLLRTTPAAALTFTSFELIARSLRRLGQQGEAAAA